jgi:hypothetical protein
MWVGRLTCSPADALRAPEAMIPVAKDKALKGDQRAAQTLINLMRELDILKPQEAFDPRIFTLYIGRPGDKSKE